MSTPTPCLVDVNGRPISSGSGRFLQAADNGGSNRPSWPTRSDSVQRLVPQWERRVMVALSEKLVCNHDVIDGALWSKAQFSFGGAWEPRFLGEDKAWGRLAEDWLLNEFYQIGDMKGPMHDSQTNLGIDSVTLDRSGDFGILLTQYDGGYPATQRVEPWRIGQPQGLADNFVRTLRVMRNPDGTPTTDTGEYAELTLQSPLRMESGIIYGPSGRPLYYRVMTDPPGATTRSMDWQDVHVQDFVHVYDPIFHSQGRGWPACYASLCALRDSLQSHEWEQLAMLIASSIGLIEYNETGSQESDPNDPATLGQPPTLPGDPTPFQAETFFGGLVRYFKAGSGAKLEQFTSNRPGNPWQEFQDRINRGALRGINWSPMLAWGAENPGGQAARSDIMQCRASISDRQKVMFYPTRRRDGYAVSKAMKLDILPPYQGKDRGGFLKWGYRLPAKLTIDDGRDSQNRRADLILGTRNLDDVLAELGDTDAESFHYRRARIAGRREQIRQEVEKEMGVQIDPREMWMPTANEQPDGEVGAGETSGEEPTKKPANGHDPEE